MAPCNSVEKRVHMVRNREDHCAEDTEEEANYLHMVWHLLAHDGSNHEANDGLAVDKSNNRANRSLRCDRFRCI